MSFVKIAIVSLIIFLLTSFTPVSLPKAFTDLLSRADMMFEAPDSLLPAKIIENKSMTYEYAIKYPDKNFEVRYAVRPSDHLWKEFELAEKTRKKGDINTNPDSAYLSLFQTVILNCSGGEFREITAFEKAAVKSEFNADWGGTVFFHPRKEFGQQYKYCMVVALHKSRAGDAFIFYLSDTRDNFNDLVLPAFHSLRFNNL